MSKNNNLNSAKKTKNDEFYTRLEDIEAEICGHRDYVDQFKDKIIYCNCDDPKYSNFYRFFRLYFSQLGIRKLIVTHCNLDGSASYKIEWEGQMINDNPVNLIKTPLNENGNFHSDECVELLKEADIVVTNPPFSLFRDYVSELMEYGKKFLIIGDKNAVKYKEIFPLFCKNEISFGYNSVKFFNTANGIEKFGNIGWFTNLDIDKRKETLELTKEYRGNEEYYQQYDDFDALNVDKVKDIPRDYEGIMGVPFSFLDRYNPSQFELVGELNHGSDSEYDLAKPIIGSIYKFPRVLIKRTA